MTRDARWGKHLFKGKRFRGGYLGTPLLSGDTLLGVICCYTQEPHDWTRDEIDLLSSFAAQAAVAIENARLLTEAEKRATDLEVLEEIGKAIDSTLDLKELFKTVAEQVRRVLRYERCSLYGLDEEERTLFPFYALDDDPERKRLLDEGLHPKIAGTHFQRVLESRKPIYVADTRKSPDPQLQLITSLGLRSAIQAPILSEGECLGFLNVGTETVDAYTEEQIDLLASVADHLGLAMKNAELYARGKESEGRFRQLSESAFEGIVITENGRILDANDASARLHGYELDELIGMSVLDLAAPESRDLVSKNVRAGYENPYEAKCLKKDGTITPIEIQGRSTSYQGRIVRVTAIRDITERKRAEEALRASETRYRTLFEQAGDAILMLDENGRIVDCNQKACVQRGYTREEMLKMRVTDIVPPEVREAATARFKRILREGMSPYESIGLRKDGSRFATEISSVPIEIEGRKRLLNFVRDITKRNEAEETLRLTQFSVERAGDATHWIATDGRFVYVNDAACEMLGYSREELLSMAVWDIDAYRRKEEWLDRGEERKRRNSYTLETRHIAKDGRAIPVEVSADLLEFGDKEYIFTSVRDITERKEAEEALRESEERFRQLSEASFEGIAITEKGRFLDANGIFAQMLGYDLSELIGMGVQDVIAPGSRELAIQHNLSGYEKPYESQCLRKDGSVFPVDIQGRSVEDEGRTVRVTAIRDITARKEAEEALRLTQFSVDRAGDGIFWIAPDGRILYVNDATSRYLGYSREELLSMSLPDFNPAYTKQNWPAQWEEWKRADPSTFETTHTAKDGRRVPVEVSATHLNFEGKEYRIGFARDITERKRAEEALRLTQFSVERAGDATYWIGPDGRFLYANDAACRYLGYSREELVKMTVSDINPQRTAEAWPERWEKMKGRGPRTFESRHLAKNGREVPVEVTANDLEFDGKEYMLSFVRDITARKEAEETLRLTQFSVDHAAHAVYWVGEDGRILYANEAARKDLGYSRDEMLSLTILDINPDYSPDKWAAHWNRLKEKGSYTFESRNAAKDGRAFPVEIPSNYLEFNGKEYVLGFARDITERKGMQDQLRQSQKMEAVGQLASGVAHDFNNILTVIMGNSSLVMELIGDPETRKRLANIEKAALSGAKTVERLQNFARKREGRPMGRIDLNTVVHDVAEMTRPRWMNESASKGIRIELSVHPQAERSIIEGEETEIQEALINLVNNALDAMPGGGRLILSTEDMEGSVRLTVSDTGQGIPPEMRDRVFEPFFTSKGERGTGLGLSMVYGTVERHGGSIYLESEPGKGTILRLSFPVAEGEPEEVSAPARAPAPSTSGRVLVIDDEEEIPHLLELWLHAMGLEIEGVSDPLEGLKAFQKNPFDLVITDLGMPDMSGWEVAKAVKEISPSAAVILMTGWGGDLDEEKITKYGIDRILQKPFKKAEAMETVLGVLKSREEQSGSNS